MMSSPKQPLERLGDLLEVGARSRRISRRTFMRGAGATVLAGLAAACGESASSGGSSTDGAPSSPAGSSYPMTIEDAAGTTTIPEAPERIVALTGVNDLDALLALGVAPVAAGANYLSIDTPGTLAPYQLSHPGIEQVQTYSIRPEYDLEVIAGFQPDLVIADKEEGRELLDQLRQLAPTLVYRYSGDWEETLRLIATAVDREEEADGVVADVAAAVGAGRERVGASPPSVAAFEVYGPGQLYVYLPDGTHGLGKMLAELGFTIPDSLKGQPQDLSIEQMELLQADVLFGMSYWAEETELLREATKSQLFQSLPAVKAGAYAEVAPETAFWWAYETALTKQIFPDDVVTRIEGLLGA